MLGTWIEMQGDDSKQTHGRFTMGWTRALSHQSTFGAGLKPVIILKGSKSLRVNHGRFIMVYRRLGTNPQDSRNVSQKGHGGVQSMGVPQNHQCFFFVVFYVPLFEPSSYRDTPPVMETFICQSRIENITPGSSEVSACLFHWLSKPLTMLQRHRGAHGYPVRMYYEYLQQQYASYVLARYIHHMRARDVVGPLF